MQQLSVKRRVRVAVGWAIGLAALMAASGCASGAALREGRTAEQRGQYHKAYVHYYRAAQLQPSSREVRSALARVIPEASRYWTDQAHEFRHRGHYTNAWRCCMQALLIRPDDPYALALSRRLEWDHPSEVATAKEGWLRYGQRTLRVSDTELADLEASGPALTRAPEEQAVASADVPPRQLPNRDRSPGEQRERSREAPVPPAAPKPTRADDRSTTPPREAPRGTRDLERTVEPAEPSPAQDGFLMTTVVSRDDERFPRRARLLENIHVEVLDTDPDPLDADLALYVGRKRVKKAGNRKIGDVVDVTAASGRMYAVEVLSIHDETETVRVGIRRVYEIPRAQPE